MRLLLLCLALLAAVPHALAQTEAPGEAERARISAERKQAEARLAAQEVACYKSFAVNDCLRAARAERRERLSDLRRQELSLNDAERRRRSTERLRGIEERETVKKQEEHAAQRAEAVVRQREKKEALEKRATDKAKAAPASVAPRTPKKPAVHDTAQELRRSQERQQEAKERRERAAKRQAEAAKSGVKPLPVPP